MSAELPAVVRKCAHPVTGPRRFPPADHAMSFEIFLRGGWWMVDAVLQEMWLRIPGLKPLEIIGMPASSSGFGLRRQVGRDGAFEQTGIR